MNTWDGKEIPAIRTLTQHRVVGIDPGSRYLGIAVLLDGEYDDHHLIKRDVKAGKGKQSGGLYEWADRCANHLDEYIWINPPAYDPPTKCHVAIEVVQSYGFVGERSVGRNVKYLVETAYIAGYLMGVFKTAAPIRPAGHGGKGADAYPDELVSPRELKSMTGQLRHCRSAYDIAQTHWDNIKGTL